MGQTHSFSPIWKIENFSLIGPHEVVESPNFGLSSVGEIAKGRLYYLTLDTAYPDDRVRLTLKSRCGDRKENRTNFTFYFTTVLGGGNFHQFHFEGKIDPEVRNGVGLYQSRSYLLQNKALHLPGDSLTFCVNIFACSSSPRIFLYLRTRIPEAKVTFSWEIVDLPAGESVASIPSPPLHFRLRRHPDSERNRFEVTVTHSKAKWIYIPCEVHLMEGPEAKTHIAHFSVSPETLSSGSYPKGSFVVSNELYESSVREAAGKSGKFTLVFEFRIRDRQAVSGGFSKKTIASYSVRIPNSVFKSSSSFPAMIEEARPAGVQAEDTFPNSIFKSSSSFPAVIEETKPAGVRAEDTFLHGDCIPGDENGEKADMIETVQGFADKECMSVLRSLYSDPVFSDFTLSAGGRSFPVHRNILSARSVVFRAMFEADMREKKESCSEVTDVDVDTLDRMLRFVYSGAFGDPDVESAAKLFATADKYQIGALRSQCVQSLASSLSVENVCRVLALADAYSDASLTALAMEFVFLNADRVFRSDEWKGLMAENPQRAGSIMHEKLSSAPYSA